MQWKSFSQFSAKTSTLFDFVSTVRLNKSSTNDFIKLTMLCTTGPTVSLNYIVLKSSIFLTSCLFSMEVYTCIFKEVYRISSDIRWRFCPSKTIPKNLDLSYKTDLDILDYFEKEKPILHPNWMEEVYILSAPGKKGWRWRFCPSKTIPKNLDLSYKADIDIWTIF